MNDPFFLFHGNFSRIYYDLKGYKNLLVICCDPRADQHGIGSHVYGDKVNLKSVVTVEASNGAHQGSNGDARWSIEIVQPTGDRLFVCGDN
jgi:hypothetical protein